MQQTKSIKGLTSHVIHIVIWYSTSRQRSPSSTSSGAGNILHAPRHSIEVHRCLIVIATPCFYNSLLQLANKVKTTYGYYNNIMTIITAPATHAVQKLQHRSSHTSHCKLQLYHITSLQKQVRRF